jgi:predicted O-methyltransferase YrrM
MSPSVPGRSESVLRRLVDSLRSRGIGATLSRVKERAALAKDTLRAARVMRKAGTAVRSIPESLGFIFNFEVGRVRLRPVQVESEIEELLEFVKADPPGSVLEIGTAMGGTLFLLSRAAAEDAELQTVDLPGGPFGSGYQADWLPLLKSMPLRSQRFRALRGDSHDEATRNQVSEWFGGKLLDFVLIDGDHRYEGVRRDFELYGSLVRPGGWIAFHDIVPGDEEMVGGVPRFWKELSERVPVTKELVESWDQGGYGLGLCQVPEGGLQPDLP